MATTLENPPDLKRLVNLIASEYKPEKIILFGSYGAGVAKEGSDIDLLIIKKTQERFVDRVVELMRLVRRRFGFAYPIEPLVYTPEEWKAAEKINSTFTRTALSKGVVLYGEE